MQKASHRQSNTGFYYGAPEPPAGANGFSQTMEYVGDFIAHANPGEEALIRLKNRFYVGDTLEALTPEGSQPFTVERMILHESGEAVETASVAGTLLRVPVPFRVDAGDLLRGPNRNHR
ncbi:MAG: U32 family peptidase C-terminal domain-containing protein [Clostridia bacterium]|nr:U32 family peptidase C-terminal domain-containing protein [Clostridia bacterium]